MKILEIILETTQWRLRGKEKKKKKKKKINNVFTRRNKEEKGLKFIYLQTREKLFSNKK